MKTKTDTVREAVASNDFKKALKIAKGFNIGISYEQKQKMSFAYECMVYPNFYKQLGMNVDEIIEAGIKTVTLIYG